MFLLRVVVFLILVSLVVILAYPLLIIFNLANGGDGFGLCSDLITCEIPFLEGPRILEINITITPSQLIKFKTSPTKKTPISKAKTPSNPNNKDAVDAFILFCPNS